WFCRSGSDPGKSPGRPLGSPPACLRSRSRRPSVDRRRA
ncbi:MAG: hypothetical protein AVDCRST_MAG45-2387, partial [uncultured Solirubrobacterales bacterium]